MVVLRVANYICFKQNCDMKKIILVSLLFIVSVNNTTAQKITTQDFNLPENIIQYVTGQMYYNVETKELKQVNQTNLKFKNGLIQSESVVLNLSNILNQKAYTYNTENQLINIFQAGGTLEGITYTENENITNQKAGNIVTIYKKGQLYFENNFNEQGKLIESNMYDAQANYIFEKTIFETSKKIVKRFNPKQELVKETTTYFNKNNDPILEIIFKSDNLTSQTVTSYFYDANGNLETTIENTHLRNKLQYNFKYVENGVISDVPTEAIIGKPETTTYYNYIENKIWIAQIANKPIKNNIIEINLRAMQTSDGQAYSITNEANFMKFIEEAYQKIKTENK
jgi:YD repeat-containing protein